MLRVFLLVTLFATSAFAQNAQPQNANHRAAVSDANAAVERFLRLPLQEQPSAACRAVSMVNEIYQRDPHLMALVMSPRFRHSNQQSRARLLDGYLKVRVVSNFPPGRLTAEALGGTVALTRVQALVNSARGIQSRFAARNSAVFSDLQSLISSVDSEIAELGRFTSELNTLVFETERALQGADTISRAAWAFEQLARETYGGLPPETFRGNRAPLGRRRAVSARALEVEAQVVNEVLEVAGQSRFEGLIRGLSESARQEVVRLARPQNPNFQGTPAEIANFLRSPAGIQIRAQIQRDVARAIQEAADQTILATLQELNQTLNLRNTTSAMGYYLDELSEMQIHWANSRFRPDYLRRMARILWGPDARWMWNESTYNAAIEGRVGESAGNAARYLRTALSELQWMRAQAVLRLARAAPGVLARAAVMGAEASLRQAAQLGWRGYAELGFRGLAFIARAVEIFMALDLAYHGIGFGYEQYQQHASDQRIQSSPFFSELWNERPDRRMDAAFRDTDPVHRSNAIRMLCGRIAQGYTQNASNSELLNFHKTYVAGLYNWAVYVKDLYFAFNTTAMGRARHVEQP